MSLLTLSAQKNTYNYAITYSRFQRLVYNTLLTLSLVPVVPKNRLKNILIEIQFSMPVLTSKQLKFCGYHYVVGRNKNRYENRCRL